MDYPRPCGCKGCRTCLLCEESYGIERNDFLARYKNAASYVFCPDCSLVYSGWDVHEVMNSHPNHSGERGKKYAGIEVHRDFLNVNEENLLMNGIDSLPWDISQSGRRKQNYGPKTNFKKMKLKPGSFNGFPEYSRFVQERFSMMPILADYQTIEQCSLEYTPERGASIDPHIDDCWVWGERILTVNCMNDTVLTMSQYKGDSQRYNLRAATSYASKLSFELGDYNDTELCKANEMCVVRIPMPSRSLIIMSGAPRYHWEHSVLREDVIARRVCIAYREFTPTFLPDGCEYSNGKPILHLARNFWQSENEKIVRT